MPTNERDADDDDGEKIVISASSVKNFLTLLMRDQVCAICIYDDIIAQIMSARVAEVI